MQVSIVDTNKLKLTKSFRLDAEYYHPRALKYEEKLLNNLDGHSVKESGCTVVSGPFGSSLKSEAYLEAGVPFVRISDLRNFLISENNLIFISNADNKRLSSSSLKIGDIVLSKVGNTIGVAAIVTANIGNCNISENNIGIRMPPKFNDAQKTFFVTYLNSVPGQNQILRAISGNAQPKLNVSDIEEILVPHATVEFVELIHSIVGKSFQCVGESFQLFSKAQYLLLAELGLTKWQPKHHLAFIKNFSDTEATERIDAEYYQPKYEEIEQAIKKYSGGYSIIGKEFKQNKSTFKIDSKKIYQYVEIGSVNISNGEIIPNEVIGEELPANAKRSLKKNDVIVSKVRTYRGAITIVEENGYVGSGAFTVLRENGRINKETLLAFLHSKPLLAWSLKPNTGTSYPVIIDNDILNLPIPLIPESKQTEIQQKVTESFSLRKQSKHLLECAKRAVEITIEKDEQTAVNWLKDQVEV